MKYFAYQAVVKMFTFFLLIMTTMFVAPTVLAVSCAGFNFPTGPGKCSSDSSENGTTQFNNNDKQYHWSCSNFNQTVDCYSNTCGDGIANNGEVCDGTDLKSNTCVGLGFSGGTLKCSSVCGFDITSCTASVCGNNKRETSEDCDGTDLGGKTCADLGFKGGTLSCSDCSFNTSACTNADTCRNKLLDAGENCDIINGTAVYKDSKNNCQAWGYNAGTLRCESNCSIAGCYQMREYCGNGVKGPFEECDSLDFDGKTCADFGDFNSGTLLCGTPLPFPDQACKVSTVNCVKTEECQAISSAPAINEFVITGKECGLANNSFFDLETGPVAGFCSPFDQEPDEHLLSYKIKIGFHSLDRTSSNQPTGWTWKCGLATCRAYPKARCNMSWSVNSVCDADASSQALSKTAGESVFKSKSFKDFDTTGFCTVGRYTPVFKDSITGEILGQYLQQGSTPNTNNCLKNKTDGKVWDKRYNLVWVCVNQPVADKLPLSNVVCSAGFGDEGRCSNVNGKDFSLGLWGEEKRDLCANNDFWKQRDKTDAELCGARNIAINKRFVREASDPKYPLINLQWFFRWDCQSKNEVAAKDGKLVTRYGSEAACATKFNGWCQTNDSDGLCGNDINGLFPSITDPKLPGTSKDPYGLCLIGSLVGSVTYNTETDTWNWKCSPYYPNGTPRNGAKNPASCSVKAKAACGPADSKGFTSEAELRVANDVNLCSVGKAFNGVKKNGNLWYWQCQQTKDSNLMAGCQAFQGCGDANQKTLSSEYFNSSSQASGFLCAKDISVSGSIEITENSDGSGWNWQCDSGKYKCQAAKLACGSAIKETVSDYIFLNHRIRINNFLCNGQFAPDFQTTVTDQYGVLNWSCYESKINQSAVAQIDCSVGKYACPIINERIAPIDLQDKYNAKQYSEFCTYGAEPVGLFSWTKDTGMTTAYYDSDAYWAKWRCQDSKGNYVTETCHWVYKSKVYKCGNLNGTEVNNKETAQTIVNAYFQQPRNGTLCTELATVDNLSYSDHEVTWQCVAPEDHNKILAAGCSMSWE